MYSLKLVFKEFFSAYDRIQRYKEMAMSKEKNIVFKPYLKLLQSSEKWRLK
jgi:hypothetical protein